MNNKKGVTLASLSIYIIVSIVVLSTLTFININFMSEIAELSAKSEYANETMSAISSLVKDIKSANRVLDYSDKHLVFDNGVKYSIKYRANSKATRNASGEIEQTYDVYELSRNDVIVTDKLTDISFGYEEKYDEYLQENFITWVTIKIADANMKQDEIYVRVGKGY